MTLSSWVRDYVFAPVLGRGGNRSEGRVAVALVVSMVVIGVWHGAGLLWALYGAIQGAAMVVERFFSLRRSKASSPAGSRLVQTFLQRSYTFNFIVIVSALCVRPKDLDGAAAMLGPLGPSQSIGPWGIVVLACAVAAQLMPLRWVRPLPPSVVGLPLWALGGAFGLVLGGVGLAAIGETPFIYFRF